MTDDTPAGTITIVPRPAITLLHTPEGLIPADPPPPPAETPAPSDTQPQE